VLRREQAARAKERRGAIAIIDCDEGCITKGNQWNKIYMPALLVDQLVHNR